MLSPDSSKTPKPPLSPQLLRVAWMSDPATMAHHLTRGRFQVPPHVRLMAQAIVETVRSGGRLLIQMPPRHGKSETASVWTPIWLLNAFPTRKVILTSYEADFAAGWGRRARNLIEEHGEDLLVRLAEDSTAANRWNTPQGGGMTTAGAGGALTGRGADLLIVDDPHKNAEEAYSKVHRERVWEWWTTTALTRLEPNAAVIVIGTRWHEDDLIGRILAQEGGERWRALRLPALAEEDDPLGRAPGAALWPERYDEAALLRTRASVGERAFEGLYQQKPLGDGAAFYKREWFEHRYDTVAPGVYRLEDGLTVKGDSLTRFAIVDLAASVKTTADYTVIGAFGKTSDGRLLVLGIDRARREGPDLIPAIKRAASAWDTPVVWVEKTGFQLAIVQEARRAGIHVRELVAKGDKIARSMPATAAFEGGKILLPRAASWLRAFEEELLAFPGGSHDDQADVLAYAVIVQASYCGRIRVSFGSPPPPRITMRPKIWDYDPLFDAPNRLTRRQRWQWWREPR